MVAQRATDKNNCLVLVVYLLSYDKAETKTSAPIGKKISDNVFKRF